jgi:ubiquinol-cytochrome c reductase cytochrome b subunit
MATLPRRKWAERASSWLDERVGHKKLLAELLDEPIPGGARWAYVFGSALTISFVVQAVTGVLLMTAYAPSAQTAWASVHYISFTLPGGWIVRGLHHFGSQAMVILLGAHLLQVAIYGAYKRPREVNWFFGLLLLAVTLGFALTGYLLPWDQKGYWATKVATNIAGTTPGLGRQLQELMQGGGSYGTLTLTRFYALHVGVLPATLVILLVGHVLLFRKHGVTPRFTDEREAVKIVDKFYPRQVWRDLVAGIVVLAGIFLLTQQDHGAPLDAPADPTSDYPARPEWYFLSLFQLLKYLHGPLEMVGTLGIPLIAGAYLFGLPFFDRKPTTALRPRLLVLSPLFLGLLGVVVLTVLSKRDDAREPKFIEARALADENAQIANRLALQGVPASGPLDMLRHDPELRGRAIFEKKCASCHVLGKLGDRTKAKAAVLDGWGTEKWILEMMHDPDAQEKMGRTPFVAHMPSMDVAPKDPPKDEPPFKPMSPEEMKAAASFLASQGNEPGEPQLGSIAAPGGAVELAAGEKIIKDRCTSCHLYKGEGDDIGEDVAPELARYGSIAWITSQVRHPATKATYREKALGPDLKGHMPRFDEQLSPADVELVARWTRAKARGVPLAAPPAQP